MVFPRILEYFGKFGRFFKFREIFANTRSYFKINSPVQKVGLQTNASILAGQRQGSSSCVILASGVGKHGVLLK